MRPPTRPCIERLPDGRGCPEYAVSGKSRCEEHQALALKTGNRSPGTTGAWKRAREEALRRAGFTCAKCGLTDTASRAAGLGGLHVHHLVGNIRTEPHDVDQLEVRCQPCHTDLVRRGTRLTLAEYQQELRKGFSP